MNTRIMAVALVVVSLIGVHAADAANAVMVRVIELNSPTAGSWAGRNITVITLGQPNEGTTTFPSGCGDLNNFSWENIEVVVIEPGHAAIRMTMHPRSDLDLAPGTRLGSITGDNAQCCLDQAGSILSCANNNSHTVIRGATFQVVAPASAGSALFSSPVELNADSIGVVTGQPNDDGTYKVIFKKQGSPAQQVDIATDDVLLAADVLRDLIDLGCDDDTGEHLYLADIEY